MNLLLKSKPLMLSKNIYVIIKQLYWRTAIHVLVLAANRKNSWL